MPNGITTWTDSEFVRELETAVREMEKRQEREKKESLARKITVLKEDINKISKMEKTLFKTKFGFSSTIQHIFYTFSLSIIALPFAELLSNLFLGLLFLFFVLVLTLITASKIIKYILFLLVV